MAAQGMNLKQRLVRLEAAFLPVKRGKRVIFIVLKKDQSTDEGLLEYMQLHTALKSWTRLIN